MGSSWASNMVYTWDKGLEEVACSGLHVFRFLSGISTSLFDCCEAVVSSVNLYSPFYDNGLACGAGRLARLMHDASCLRLWRPGWVRRVLLEVFVGVGAQYPPGRGVVEYWKVYSIFQAKICDFPLGILDWARPDIGTPFQSSKISAMNTVNQKWLPFALTFEKGYKVASVNAGKLFLMKKNTQCQVGVKNILFQTKMWKSMPFYKPKSAQKLFSWSHTCLYIPKYPYNQWTTLF